MGILALGLVALLAVASTAGCRLPPFDASLSEAVSGAEDDTSGSPGGSPLSIYLSAGTTITRFDDMAGSNPQSYDGSNGTAFTNVNDIFVDGSGIYAVDRDNSLIYRFDDMTGAGHEEFDGSTGVEFGAPYSIHVFGGNIYVTDFNTSNPGGQRVLQRFGDMAGAAPLSYDGGLIPFDVPRYVWIDTNGIYVSTDFNNELLYRFDDMSGTNQVTNNGGATPFSRVRDIATDSAGRIYVLDNVQVILYRFDDINDTTPVTYDGSAGTPFSNVENVAIDALDRIYVNDPTAGTLYRFDDMTGAGQVELDTGGIGSAKAMFVVGP